MNVALLQNVSVQSGTLARDLRHGEEKRTSRRLQAFSTYRREMAPPLAAVAPIALQRPQGGMFGELPKVRTAPRVGRRVFNPLERLLTRASPSFSRGASFATSALAGAVLEAPAASPRTLLSSPDAHVLPPTSPSGGLPAIGSDLGWPSDFFSHYVLGECLGQGSFGTVYLATDKLTAEQVAVKVLPKEPLPPAGGGPVGARSRYASRERVLAKLRRETEFLRRLQGNGNAVGLKGTYEDRCFVYIVMEHCTGGDLETLVEKNGPLTESQAAHVVYECLTTIVDCHRRRILHGDVKPANFMLKEPLPDSLTGVLRSLEPGSWLRAIDFGCAQAVTEGVPLTRKTGTPMFMAPEVYVGNYGLEADMWSLGMMMYQMLADRFPFWNSMEELHSTTLDQVMKAVIMEDIPLDYGPWRSLSKQGMSLIKRLLCRTPEDRITAEEALHHPWFALHGAGKRGLARTTSGNVLPVTRRMSDTMRLRMAAVDLQRARSGKADDWYEGAREVRREASYGSLSEADGLFATYG